MQIGRPLRRWEKILMDLEQDERVWTGFFLLRIRTNGRAL
jgi:hypothetical protein